MFPESNEDLIQDESLVANSPSKLLRNEQKFSAAVEHNIKSPVKSNII